MSAEEPLYCTHCGAEDFGCDCPVDGKGEYCEVCGVIHADRRCPFDHYEARGRPVFLDEEK